MDNINNLLRSAPLATREVFKPVLYNRLTEGTTHMLLAFIIVSTALLVPGFAIAYAAFFS